MATSIAASKSLFSVLDADRHDSLGMVLSATLPLAVYVIVNGMAQLYGVQSLFFAPFGLPGWVGAALHLACLPLFGIARWMVAGRSPEGDTASKWVIALMAGTIVFPFVVAPLDSLMLSILAFGLLVVGLAAAIRVAAVDRKAALVMAPGMAWMGFSAFVGLSFAAAWSPPFAVTNGHGAA